VNSGSFTLLPAWMFSSESTAFSVGPPAIAIEALSELRDLLNSLLKSSPCDKPRPHRRYRRRRSMKSHRSPSVATQSRVARSQADRTSVGRTTQTRPRSGRAAHQRRRSRRARRSPNESELTNERLKTEGSSTFGTSLPPNKCFTTKERQRRQYGLADKRDDLGFRRRPG